MKHNTLLPMLLLRTLLLASTVLPMFSSAQKVVDRKGSLVGERKVLIKQCIAAQQASTARYEGVVFAASDLCPCLVDAVVPFISRPQWETVKGTGRMVDLVDLSTAPDLFLECIEPKAAIADDAALDDWLYSYMGGSFFQRDCRKGILDDKPKDDWAASDHASTLCSCLADLLRDGTIDRERFLGNGGVNMEAFLNPEAVQYLDSCKQSVEERISFGDDHEEPDPNLSNGGIFMDSGPVVRVPLKPWIAGAYTFQITISDVPRTVIYDPKGLDDLELQGGLAGFEDELHVANNYAHYTLRDSSTLFLRDVELMNVIIGDHYLPYNRIGLTSDGRLLFGEALRYRYASYRVDTENSMLIFEHVPFK